MRCSSTLVLPLPAMPVTSNAGHILVADDEVLLLLDGGGDGLHVFGAAARKAIAQQRVLDGDIGVEIRAKRFALDVELRRLSRLTLMVRPLAS